MTKQIIAAVLGALAALLVFFTIQLATNDVDVARHHDKIRHRFSWTVDPGDQGWRILEILYTTTVHKGSIHVEAHVVRVNGQCQLVWSEHALNDTGASPRTTTSWPVECPR